MTKLSISFLCPLLVLIFAGPIVAMKGVWLDEDGKSANDAVEVVVDHGPDVELSAPVVQASATWIGLSNDLIALIFSFGAQDPYTLVCLAQINRRANQIIFSDSVAGRLAWRPCMQRFFPISEQQNPREIGQDLIALLNESSRLAELAHHPRLWRRLRVLDTRPLLQHMQRLPLGVSASLQVQVDAQRPNANEVFQALADATDSIVLTPVDRRRARDASIDLLANAGSRRHQALIATAVVGTNSLEPARQLLYAASGMGLIAAGHEAIDRFHLAQLEQLDTQSRAHVADRFMAASRMSGGLAAEALEYASLEGAAAMVLGRGNQNRFLAPNGYNPGRDGLAGPIALGVTVTGEFLTQVTGYLFAGLLSIVTYPFAWCARYRAVEWIPPAAAWGADIGRVVGRVVVGIPVALLVGLARATALGYRATSHVVGRCAGYVAGTLALPCLCCSRRAGN